MASEPLHTLEITTPRGSHVVLPYASEAERDAAAANLTADTTGPPPAAGAAAQKTTCSRCGGAGGWNEKREQKTGSGGTVVVTVWVNCRPCGGSGKVPK